MNIEKEIREQVEMFLYYSKNDQPERAAWALEGAVEDAQDEIFEGDRAQAQKYVNGLITRR